MGVGPAASSAAARASQATVAASAFASATAAASATAPAASAASWCFSLAPPGLTATQAAAEAAAVAERRAEAEAEAAACPAVTHAAPGSQSAGRILVVPLIERCTRFVGSAPGAVSRERRSRGRAANRAARPGVVRCKWWAGSGGANSEVT
eukprot:scaffold115499_cov45-Phaeocystis_antarctica.AAC.1